MTPPGSKNPNKKVAGTGGKNSLYCCHIHFFYHMHMCELLCVLR